MKRESNAAIQIVRMKARMAPREIWSDWKLTSAVTHEVRRSTSGARSEKASRLSKAHATRARKKTPRVRRCWSNGR